MEKFTEEIATFFELNFKSSETIDQQGEGVPPRERNLNLPVVEDGPFGDSSEKYVDDQES